jgi:hypothetical protein
MEGSEVESVAQICLTLERKAFFEKTSGLFFEKSLGLLPNPSNF